MGNKHEYTKFKRARDELFSHIQRCDVLDADDDHRGEWLQETMEFMGERYPSLSKLQLAQLELLGRRYISPVIPHGRGHNAVSMDRDTETEIEEVEEVDPEPQAA